ncbi:hypothetical protein JCM24511_04084 [Saitozyma sp. JCM 24511]|nr:hypothetical protein JCM24511_04084 [Saitozyma sp. JCM 24511]
MPASIPKTTRVIINANPPVGEIKPDTFKVEERPLPELQEGQVLVKILALGNEPAQRNWLDTSIDERRLYAPPIRKGDVVRSPAIAEVLASKSGKWKEGQRVTGFFGWTEYAVVKEEEITREAANVKGQSEWISLGALGLTGLTAWAGAFDVCHIKPEHTVLVSGAAGAVGSAFVQIAKNVVGCAKVVGVAGGKEKCDWVKKLGADECLDYKSPDFEKDLKAALPDYADVFFDNVGGKVLDLGLTVVKRYGFICQCGAISGYQGKPLTLEHYGEVIMNRLTIKGMILMDHVKLIPQASQELQKWVEEGKIDVTEGETVVDTKFEDVPKTWQLLFTGGNKGKLVTKLV